MKKTLIIGLLAIFVLVSGCTSTTTVRPAEPTPIATSTPMPPISIVTPIPPVTPIPTPTPTKETYTPTPTPTPIPKLTTTPMPTATPKLTATPTPTEQPSVNVNITNLNFVPTTVYVPVGKTVNWINNDNVTHTITSVTGSFDSGSIDPGTTYSYTFNQTGTYEYSCTIHAIIPHGRVIVT
ncbi:Cupredoxin-like domain protein [uncultured archaeon]|nr:Cupredoxin-like domain protein [uncultured archaeon]